MTIVMKVVRLVSDMIIIGICAIVILQSHSPDVYGWIVALFLSIRLLMKDVLEEISDER